MNRKIKILLFIILLSGALLRLYQISSIPVSLYWDETAVAYNAYSIFNTARDEYGNFLPLIFRSFNDYKMPGFVYMTGPFVGLLGLTEFATRLPSALAGILGILLAYLLTRELFNRKVAIVTALLLAVSPWHLQFSRTGFEANVALTLFLLGFWLFLLSIKNRIHFIIPFIAFSASVYFYRSIHGFLPFFLFGLILIYFKRQYIFGALIMAILVLPIFTITVLNKGSVRFQQVSIVTNPNGPARSSVYAVDFIKGYFSHFSPGFLFFNGDGFARHKVEGMGLMYLIELPILVIGIWQLFRGKNKKIKIVFLLWALTAPIPAAVAIPSPHALRSLNFLPLFQILVALGLVWLLRYKKLIFIVLCLYVFSIGYYLNSYYVVSSKNYSSVWADGYKKLTQYIFNNEGKYDKVLVTGHQWQPYVYFLFYRKYPPAQYQKNGTSKGFANYIFGPTGWDEGGNRPELEYINLKDFSRANRVLVVLSPNEYNWQKDNLKYLTEIRDHNNDLIFVVGETK